MCEKCENNLNVNDELKINKEDLNENCEVKEISEYEEALNYLAYLEEEKRIELQDNPTSKTSKETKNSEFYKNSMIIAETVGEVLQKLLGYGVDYNNAIVLASNIMTNDANLKLTKLQEVKNEQSQI